jgi:hypothetical protein
MDECARFRKRTLAEISGLVLGLVLSITEHLQKVSAAFRRLAQHLLAERQKLVHHLLYVTCQESPLVSVSTGPAVDLASSRNIACRVGVNWTPRVSGEIADDFPPSIF